MFRAGLLPVHVGPAIQAFPVRPASGGISSSSNSEAAFEERAIQFHENPTGGSDSDLDESDLHRTHIHSFRSVPVPGHIDFIKVK